MAIPAYLWIKDDGGADIKGSVDVKDNDAGQEVEYFNMHLENVKVVSVNPVMHNCKEPALQIHNHNEGIQLRYEKITWKYCDGNVQYSDAWNERQTA